MEEREALRRQRQKWMAEREFEHSTKGNFSSYSTLVQKQAKIIL